MSRKKNKNHNHLFNFIKELSPMTTSSPGGFVCICSRMVREKRRAKGGGKELPSIA
jgi:hypothetical protein